MEFPTYAFAWFFLVTLTVATALRAHRRLRNAFLLLASYAFCWRFQPLFLLAVVGSSLGNWAVGELLYRVRDRGARRVLLGTGVGANLALLGYFKYYSFFVDNVNDLLLGLGSSRHLPLLEVVTLLGVSFYTFQGIAYLVDTWRGTASRPGSLLDFLLFMAFFPRFAAGPICRSHELLPQIMSDPAARPIEVSRAATLVVTGLFKKMVLGTWLATHMVEDAFQQPESWSAVELWVVAFAYTAQIYLDFSGYTDIARGCALALGFELPENFRHPYAATSVGEFWRRWHLSFSRWLRDYVYLPLGGSRGSQLRTAGNLMVTFLLCGLWHGPSWGYVLWGGLHGLALVTEKLRRDRRRGQGLPPDPPPSSARAAVGWAMTLGYCALARIFFKSPDLTHAVAFFRGLVDFGRPLHAFEPGVVVVTALTVVMNFVGAPVYRRFLEWHERLSAPMRLVAWTTISLALLMVRPFDVAFTIYFRY